MKRSLFVFFVAIVFCCCKRNIPDIAYEGKIETETTCHPVAVTLNDSFMFSWPRGILIMDSLLIVHDSYNQAECFHVFHKDSGTHLKSFGKKGRGPGEFMEVNSFNNNYDGRSVTVFDPNSRKIIVFDMHNILEETQPRFRELTVENAPNFVKQMLPYRGNFIAKGNDDKMRYGIWTPPSDVFSNIYVDYPRLAEDREDNWSLTDYSAKVRLSPDGRKLIAVTYIGGIMEIFDLNENGFESSTIRYFSNLNTIMHKEHVRIG